jgi:hypothetical protein
MGVKELIPMIHHEKPPVARERVLKFLRALCPTVELTEVAGRFHTSAVNRIDAATRLHLDTLVGLADNQQFLVTGGAGTGKTYLAEKWARRCAARGEKTLFLSYNVPLAEDIAVRVEDTDIVVGSFHRYLETLLKPHGHKIPSNPPTEWLNAASRLTWLIGTRLMLVATRLILRICRADYAPRILSCSCTGCAFDLRRAPILSSSTNTEKAMLAYT